MRHYGRLDSVLLQWCAFIMEQIMRIEDESIIITLHHSGKEKNSLVIFLKIANI